MNRTTLKEEIGVADTIPIHPDDDPALYAADHDPTAAPQAAGELADADAQALREVIRCGSAWPLFRTWDPERMEDGPGIARLNLPARVRRR